MRIRHARPARMEPTPSGFRTLVRFALEPSPGVLIYDCTIVQAPDGRLLVYGPSSKTAQHILSLAPEVRREVIAMTLHEVGIDDEFRSAA